MGLVPRKRCSASLRSELSLQELKKRNHLRVPGNERWSPYPEAKCLWALSAASWHELNGNHPHHLWKTASPTICIDYKYYLIQDILKVHTKNLNSTHRTLMHAVDIVVYNAANWNNDTYPRLIHQMCMGLCMRTCYMLSPQNFCCPSSSRILHTHWCYCSKSKSFLS